MKRLKYLFIAFFITFFAFPSHEATAAEENLTMEVKLKNYLGNRTSAEITATGDYRTSRGEIFIKAGEKLALKVESAKLAVYKGSKKKGSYASFKVIPVKPDSSLSINGRPYQGSFSFTAEDGYIRPINTVYMEDYLKGVVPLEMPALWHPEALKAQAIAARTYALRHQSTIIDDTVSYQVYGGAAGHYRTNSAIEQTKDMVIKHDGEIIEAFFSSSNGGMTESNSNVWSSGNPLAYLSIKEDFYDPKTSWEITLDKQQIDLSKMDLAKPEEWWTSVEEKDKTVVPKLKAWLKNNGYAQKDIKITEIPLLTFSDEKTGGRVTKGSIQLNFYVRDLVDDRGKLLPQTVRLTNVSASKIRGMVGQEVMKSYLVDHSSSDHSKISIKGSGYGHGVGLSQFGAKNRAEAGQSYLDILGFYYPDTTIEREYGPGAGFKTDLVAKAEPNSVSMKAQTDHVNDEVGITYSLKENTVVTLTIKDGKGKSMATPVRDQTMKKGTHSAIWNTKAVSNGTYKAEISAMDRNGNEGLATMPIKISKDTSAPKITEVKTSGDYSTEQANITYIINENANVTVEIKNSKGKVVGILSERPFSKGRQSATWDFKNMSSGIFTVTISAKDKSDNQKTISTKISIRKTTGIVTASELYIKENRNASSETVGNLYRDQSVTILAQQDEWYKVKKGSQIGYVLKKHIKK
ncbi:SpoIID/LytB domain protein [Peribacillus frigoritolerans]|uniref:SpoIID/LytB domain-containing protein n=1 Tax=Peribacillus frigoritolerans TaxID=450367 RepID=UPI001198FCD0|nr:SpoIID/LytB domain-containing protein [Peribacillus frigoritolerans]TWD96047.1 SpoIID/LytB domain protein [Peribacillus frigoritolerans]